MKFFVTGTKRRRVEYEITTEETISITKAEVMRITDCPAKEDGDSTAWYNYVAEALLDPDCRFTVVESYSNKDLADEHEWFESVDVEWL